MKCFAFSLIAYEALAYKAHLKHEAELASSNVTSLEKAKMEIEAMFQGVA